MYSSKSYLLTFEEYNYLLPVLRCKLHISGDTRYFIGSSDELGDMLDRLKGLYNCYDLIDPMVCYYCFINGSIKTFRDKM